MVTQKTCYFLFLSLILVSALPAHAAFPIPKAPDAPDVAPEPVVPDTPSDPASDPSPESGSKPEGTSPNEPDPIGPPATVPGEYPGEDPESEASDIGEHLSDILDAITSLASLAVVGTTAAATTITSAPIYTHGSISLLKRRGSSTIHVRHNFQILTSRHRARKRDVFVTQARVIMPLPGLHQFSMVMSAAVTAMFKRRRSSRLCRVLGAIWDSVRVLGRS